MPKLFTVQQDIDKVRASYQLAPCPFCGSSKIEFAPPTETRPVCHLVCASCGVTVHPPSWQGTSEALAIALWNQRR